MTCVICSPHDCDPDKHKAWVRKINSEPAPDTCDECKQLRKRIDELEEFLDHEHKIRFDRENVPQWQWYFKEWKKKKSAEPEKKSLTEQMRWCEITEGREGYKNSLDLWLDWRKEDI